MSTLIAALAWWNEQGQFLRPQDGDAAAWDAYTREPTPRWVEEARTAQTPDSDALCRESGGVSRCRDLRPDVCTHRYERCPHRSAT